MTRLLDQKRDRKVELTLSNGLLDKCKLLGISGSAVIDLIYDINALCTHECFFLYDIVPPI